MIRTVSIRTVFAVTAIALGVCAAVAQQDPIAARRALMKANGDAAKTAGAMAVMFVIEVSPKGTTYNPLTTGRETAAVGWLPAALVPSLLQ